MEEWREIEGYEGLYQVSNLGRVKSLKNHKGTYREKILKPTSDKLKYERVALYKNGKQKRFQIHRLVATAFILNPNNLPCVNHIDENPSNNHVSNLEWCTYEYNINYGSRNKKVSEKMKGKYIGSKHCKSKKVKCMTTGEIFDSIADAGRKYNIGTGDISKCCRGKLKSAGKHPATCEKMVWEYEKG